MAVALVTYFKIFTLQNVNTQTLLFKKGKTLTVFLFGN